MQSWGPKREVEKVKPIKLRAGFAATRLIQLREAYGLVVGGPNNLAVQAMTEAIDVLLVVEGHRK